MHRAGTSVLTHLLSRMGCHAGTPESLKPGDAANERGYWERWDAWALDEQILAAAGASWREVAGLDLGSLAEDARQRFEAHARDLVAGLDEHRPWVLKDPRLCLLLPLWKPALSAPVYVLTHRDPLETARSLRARDGLPLAVGVALWEVYNLEALRHSLGAPRLCVSHRRLLSDPAGVAADLAADLAPFAPGALRIPDADELAEVVASELHHQRAHAQEHAGYLNGSQEALRRALDDGTALAWEVVPPPSAGALDTLRSLTAAENERLTLSRQAAELAGRCAEAEGAAAWRRDREVEHERWIASLQESLAAAEVEHKRWVASLQEALTAAEDELGRLRQRDAGISSWNETLTARLSAAESEAARLAAAHLELGQVNAELEQRIDRLQGDLQARQREVDELQRLLGEMAGLAERSWLQAGELDRLVEEILGSLIWRAGRSLTAPVRWGRHAVTAESHHETIRGAIESLEAAHRALAMRAAPWIAGDDTPKLVGE